MPDLDAAQTLVAPPPGTAHGPLLCGLALLAAALGEIFHVERPQVIAEVVPAVERPAARGGLRVRRRDVGLLVAVAFAVVAEEPLLVLELPVHELHVAQEVC